MKVNVEIEEEWVGTYGADEEDDGPWSYRGVSKHRSVISEVTRSDRGEFEVEGDHDEVYVVYSEYSTGDTFGRNEGYMSVIGVVATEDEAKAFVKAAEDYVDSRKMATPSFNGKPYYVSGSHDFFGGVDGIDYELMEVS